MIGKSELERLKLFALTVANFILESESAKITAASATQYRSIIQKSKSVRDIRQISRDLIEWADGLNCRQLALLDTKLSRHNLPTLSAMRQKRNREFSKILIRGSVISEDEFRLLNSAVSDIAAEWLTPADRLLAEQILGAYMTSRTT